MTQTDQRKREVEREIDLARERLKVAEKEDKPGINKELGMLKLEHESLKQKVRGE